MGSDDLALWRFHPEPVLKHRTDPGFPNPAANAFWDGGHVRPRSLNLIGDTWYVLYEGANTEPNGEHLVGCWDDSIGLARSTDLLNWKMDFPLELAIPQQPGDGFDSLWTG